MAITKTAKKLAEAIKTESKETKPYDTTATVSRIENGTAWVHIPGGVDETPVKLTMNAKVGDTVQVRVGGGRAWLTGNATNPPTDDTTANKAQNTANVATKTAEAANTAAQSAQQAADTAWSYADSAHTAATEARNYADDAQISATNAYTSAQNANEYAVRAYANLGSVESVAETLAWITKHGTMVNTQSMTPPETSLDPAKVYFIQDAAGEYTVGNQRYSLVKEPKSEDIATYYVLSINESLNNYVATHLALTDEGLAVVNTSTTDYHLIVTPSGVILKDNTGDIVARYGTSVVLGGGGNTVTTITNEAMTCDKFRFKYLYPQGTNLVLEARANGHFSIKPLATS